MFLELNILVLEVNVKWWDVKLLWFFFGLFVF